MKHKKSNSAGFDDFKTRISAYLIGEVKPLDEKHELDFANENGENSENARLS